MSRPLRADDVMRDLGTRRIGRAVRCLEACVSTNEAAFELAASGVAEGTVIVAEEQTGGRGRHGRRWHSPRGGLWCSVVLRPTFAPADRPFLTVLGAVGMARAVESVTGLVPRIRWPNDLMVQGRKGAGILVEVRDGPGAHVVAVLGVGCNVDAVPSDLPAEVAAATAALAPAAGAPVDRQLLLRVLLRELDDLYEGLRNGQTEPLDAEWRERSAVLHARVRVTSGDEAVEGLVVAVGATAGITLATAAGDTRREKAA